MQKPEAENEKVLGILKRRGAQPISDIAKALQVTTEGARFHLQKLTGKGLVQSTKEIIGRGRPRQVWSLTQEGHARFPDTHSELTVKIIESVRKNLGEEALKEVIRFNERKDLERYQAELSGCDSMESRVAGLAEIRNREGYMAFYEKTESGFMLIENHCPICSAATTCQTFCRAELNIFRTVLGKAVSVERVEHIIEGARRCAYRITLK